MSKRTCSVEECGRPHHSKGFCQLHSNRDRRGTPMNQPIRILDPERGCSVAGCEGEHRGRGLCRIHYDRQRLGIPMNQPIRSYDPGRGCSVVDCERPHQASGLCNLHWQRQRLGIAMGQPVQIQDPDRGCSVAGCERRHHAKGLCGLHNRRQRYPANPERSRARNAKRRARKAQTLCDLSMDDQKDILARGCLFAHLGDCEGSLALAHDVAVSKGGNTTRANVFCLCNRHNGQMHTKGLAEMMTQMPLVMG